MTLRNDLVDRIDRVEKIIKENRKNLKQAEQALIIIQTVAKQTQEQLQYKISELVSLALESVFPDPYKMRLIYEIKRNKTEARMVFEKNGMELDPLTSTGGGTVDVASFALRLTLLSLSRNSFDNVIILDEPFKFISRDLIPKVVDLLKELHQRLGTQFIIVTHLRELAEAADKLFLVEKNDDLSTITEI